MIGHLNGTGDKSGRSETASKGNKDLGVLKGKEAKPKKVKAKASAKSVVGKIKGL